MPFQSKPNYTAFLGFSRVATGSLHDVAVALYVALRQVEDATPLVFSDETGEQVDVDLRGSKKDVAARYPEEVAADSAPPIEHVARSRGRPKLGVVAREVTLLPEHWDWLAAQPGGASVALRKLVHEARRQSAEHDQHRHAQERAYRVMSTLAGNLAAFEEASRALFAGKLERLASEAQVWPSDVREYVLRLAGPGMDAPVSNETQTP